MKLSFQQLLKQLKEIIYLMDGTQVPFKIQLLKSIAIAQWKAPTQLVEYHEVLLFLASHPENKQILQLVEKEFKRITLYLKNCSKKDRQKYNDTGVPYTNLLTRFSHDLFYQLQQDQSIQLSIDSYEEEGVDLNTLLKMTLPALEKDETTAGLGNNELLNALGIPPNQQLNFLLNEFSTLNAQPSIKDYLWESMKLFVEVAPSNPLFSRSYNRMAVQNVFFQNQLLKKFDSQQLIELPLPKPVQLSLGQKEEIAKVVQHSLTLTLRETDPSTYMDLSTLRLYELDRGISIAIYGMNEYRQLPLQSYIGYTLFKNGFPAAYGGSWIFGQRAMFGLNIFEAFRGGESGYMMCQLLRVYKQVFKLTYIDVEPYQYGLDNPDGIRTGAFWFYYRYGFRPVNSSLFQLAEHEHGKIKNNIGYRSSEKILLQFTKSNIALQYANRIPTDLGDIKSTITKLIASKYNGNRTEAIEHTKHELLSHFNSKFHFIKSETMVLEDMAFLVKVLKKKPTLNIQLIKKLIKTKPVCPYQYNELLIKFLTQIMQ